MRFKLRGSRFELTGKAEIVKRPKLLVNGPAIAKSLPPDSFTGTIAFKKKFSYYFEFVYVCMYVGIYVHYKI